MAAEIDLQPSPATWPKLLREGGAGQGLNDAIREWRLSIRQELNLPTDRLIIAIGHQPGIWHPGILAKFLAADALAAKVGRDRVAIVHLVVDQDTNEVSPIEIPIETETDSDAQTHFVSEPIELIEKPAHQMTAVNGQVPAARAIPIPVHLKNRVPKSVARGLLNIHDALGQHASAATLAQQFAEAANQLMQPRVAEMHTINASALLATEFGSEVLATMQFEREACVASYNNAVQQFPDAGLTELVDQNDRLELPLWRIDKHGNRHRVFFDDIEAFELQPTDFRPRALLMTAIMRLAVCDLFIHGRGGFVYDKVMEAWLSEWWDVQPVPMVMATADVLLRLRPGDDNDDSHTDTVSLDESLVNFRHFLHDPLRRDSEHISPAKQKHLNAIAAELPRSTERRSRFREYHQWLIEQRRRHSDELARLLSQVQDAQRALLEKELRTKRNWAFPLYKKSAIDELARTVQSALGAEKRTPGH